MNMSTTVAYWLLYTLADSGFLRQKRQARSIIWEKSLLLGYSAIRSQELEENSLSHYEEAHG